MVRKSKYHQTYKNTSKILQEETKQKQNVCKNIYKSKTKKRYRNVKSKSKHEYVGVGKVWSTRISSINKYSIIVHGGAGKGSKRTFRQMEDLLGIMNIESKHHESLQECILIGEDILKKNGTAIDAVTQCIKYLEDNELFNAGKGSVRNIDNTVYLDSCITEGSENNYGSICSINNIKNPIELSRALMLDKSLMISGNKSSLYFSKKYNIRTVRPSYYKSVYRDTLSKIHEDLGTVGAVAIDNYGNICAGTSTGGRQKKMRGRIGDTPLVGISTLAENETVGISCSGEGEEIIKSRIASQILYRMKWNQETLEKSIQSSLKSVNGSCGIIGIDKDYNIYYESNTERMFIGYKKHNTEIKTHLWEKKIKDKRYYR